MSRYLSGRVIAILLVVVGGVGVGALCGIGTSPRSVTLVKCGEGHSSNGDYVYSGSKYVGELCVVNSGVARVEIVETRTSCGCASVTFPNAAMSSGGLPILEPKSTTRLETLIDTRLQSGNKEFLVTLFYRPSGSEIISTVSGRIPLTIRRGLVAQPSTVVWKVVSHERRSHPEFLDVDIFDDADGGIAIATCELVPKELGSCRIVSIDSSREGPLAGEILSGLSYCTRIRIDFGNGSGLPGGVKYGKLRVVPTRSDVPTLEVPIALLSELSTMDATPLALVALDNGDEPTVTRRISVVSHAGWDSSARAAATTERIVVDLVNSDESEWEREVVVTFPTGDSDVEGEIRVANGRGESILIPVSLRRKDR